MANHGGNADDAIVVEEFGGDDIVHLGEVDWRGRIKPLVAYPETRLTTLVATHLGLARYSDLPPPSFAVYACLLTPLAYLFIFDNCSLGPKDLRHLKKEGRLLREFRAACRRFFDHEDEDLERDVRALGDLWLSFTSQRNQEGHVPDDLLDALVEEAAAFCRPMAQRLMEKHANAQHLPRTARRVFLLAGSVLDSRLPTHLRQAAIAAEKAEAQARSRLQGGVGGEGGGGEGGGRFPKRHRPEVPKDHFYCQSCKKVIPKAEGAAHVASEEHQQAKKNR